MLAGTGRPARWRFNPCTEIAKKGLLTSLLCISVAGAALYCLSRLHVSDICQGGHPLPETAVEVGNHASYEFCSYLGKRRATLEVMSCCCCRSGMTQPASVEAM